MPKVLPLAGGGCIPFKKKDPSEDGKIPDRVYIDEFGKEHPWVCEENPAMWTDGQSPDED